MQSLIQNWGKKADIEAPVARLCTLLGVSRAGIYAARQRQQRPCADAALSKAVQAAFADSGHSYGSRRICATLHEQGVEVGRYRVRRIMREQRLTVRWRRKHIHTTHSRHDLPVVENVLNRQFNPDAPNRAWVCDITYVRTRTGWLYLAAVMDLYSRKIIGWASAPVSSISSC